MKNRPRSREGQRGVAVITALLLTTLAITIVASLFWQQQVQVRSIENQRLQLQKQWILRGAIDWARLILREDVRYSSIDSLDEPWAVPLSETRLDQYVENGQTDSDASDAALSGSVIDAQSRLNLTNLAPNGTINPEEVDAFARLLTSQRVDPALAARTAEFMRRVTTLNAVQGQTGDGTPPQLPLAQVDDLLAIPGYTPENVETLRPFVIVLPRATPVNVNTAPAEVLAARIPNMSAGDAASLVAARRTAAFRSISDVSSRLPGGAGNLASTLAVATNFFLVNGNVRLSRAGLNIQALIERNGPKTSVIWVREY
jgi:general secretion pathway protein K